MNDISIEINLLQNILNSESDKDIDKYKEIRKEYIELKKEQDKINSYLLLVNNEENSDSKNELKIK